MPQKTSSPTRACAVTTRLKQCAYTLLKLCYRFVAGRRVDDEPLGNAQQLAQLLERPEGEILRSFDVLELARVADAELGELVDAGCVELLTSEAQHDVAAVNESSSHDDQEFGLEPEPSPVVDPGLGLNEFRAVQDLPLALLEEKLQDVLGVARLPWLGARLRRAARVRRAPRRPACSSRCRRSSGALPGRPVRGSVV